MESSNNLNHTYNQTLFKSKNQVGAQTAIQQVFIRNNILEDLLASEQQLQWLVNRNSSKNQPT